MLRLAKAFWDIALWRKSPAQLPASAFLLCLVATVAAALEALGALLPPTPSGRIPARVALSVALPLLFAWLVLAVARQRQRFLQTGSALLGVAVLAQLVLYPLGSLLNFVGIDRPVSLPLGLLLLAGLIWYLLACANIWRAALDAHLVVGAAISVGYLLLSMALEQQLLPKS
jgi:hypothetical protein